MHAGKSQGAKKRFIKRDHSEDDEPDVDKAIPLSSQPPEPPHPSSLQARGSPFHHSQSSTAPLLHTPQEQQVYRRQVTTPQQQRRQVMRSPSLNSPKIDRRLVVTSLSPLHSGEFRPSPVNFQAEVTSARAPRSPRPLKRANTERSSSSQPLSTNHFTIRTDQPQVNRNRRREAIYDQIPPQAVNSYPQPHSEVYRRHSNEPLQSTPSRPLNRASVESDTSFNRLHASVLSPPPTEGLKSSSGNITSAYNQQAMERTEDYKHTPRQWTDPATTLWQDGNRFEHHHRPQVSRYPSRSPTHHKGPGFSLQLGNCPRYPSPCNFSDGNKTRSSSLTDSIPGVQSPPSLVNTSAVEKVTYPFLQKQFQNQNFEARNSQVEHRPLCRSGAQLDSDRSRESSGRGCSPDAAPGGVFLRHKKERPESNAKNRRSFYDNDSLPDQSEQFEDSTQPAEMFSSPGNTWKSQTAPSSFSVFKRPVYGKIAQVVPPHLVGVFDPKKCLPLKRSNSKPTDYISRDQSFHEAGAPRNRASDSSFRYSDPVSHYGVQEGNFPDHAARRANDKTNDMPADPKQLNQFLSLYSGPWSKETSLFGRANAAKETRKLETNWKKYEEYQDPYPSKVVAKGKTQKELDEHVELMEKLRPQRIDPTEAAVHGETAHRTTLSRSHESIDSSQETVPKPREHILKSGSTKSRSQELPIHKRRPQEGNANLGFQEGFHLELSTSPNQRSFDPDKKAVQSQTPTTCISVKQLTLSVPEQEIVVLPSPENFSNDKTKDSGNMERASQLSNDTESKLHTSRLDFLPSNSTSPRLMRKEMQASEWRQEDVRSQRSSDPGMESSNSSKTDKYISCVTIPESELFRCEENKQDASTEETSDIPSAAGLHYPQIQATQLGKSRARRTKSDSTSINRLAFPIEGDTNSAITEGFQKQQLLNPKSLSYFTFPDMSEEISATSTEIAKAKDTPREHQLPSNKLANLCEDFLNDNFSFSDLQSPQTEPPPFDFKKPTQSSELSISGGSSSSLSLGESSFAAFCLQHQTDQTAKPATESDAKTPTNIDQTPLKDTNDPEVEAGELMFPSASQSSAKKLKHSLSKQDSFNSPDSPLFHKTLPLPKDSVILHHRRHYLKECASFQSSSSSSEDSDLENFSALRLTPRRPRRNKQRSVV